MRFWLGVVVSLGCLWLALRAVPLGEMGEVLVDGQYLWLLPAVVVQALAVVVRAHRWVVLLGGTARLSDAFWAQGVGYLGTNVLPFRLGEVARVVLMARQTQLPLARVAASAVIERISDVVTILIVLGCVLLWMPVPALIIQAGLSLAVLVVLMVVGLVILAGFGRQSEGWLSWLCRRLPGQVAALVVDRWRELAAGLVVLADGRVALATAGWSLVTWGLSLATFWCIIQAYVATGTLLEAAFMLVALALSVTVPSSPGFIGVFQLVGQQALVLPFGDKYTLSSALAIAVATHLTYYLFTSMLGMIGLWRLGGTLTHGGGWRPAIGHSGSSRVAPNDSGV